MRALNITRTDTLHRKRQQDNKRELRRRRGATIRSWHWSTAQTNWPVSLIGLLWGPELWVRIITLEKSPALLAEPLQHLSRVFERTLASSPCRLCAFWCEERQRTATEKQRKCSHWISHSHHFSSWLAASFWILQLSVEFWDLYTPETSVQTSRWVTAPITP